MISRENMKEGKKRKGEKQRCKGGACNKLISSHFI
jgi:hypothetical protein